MLPSSKKPRSMSQNSDGSAIEALNELGAEEQETAQQPETYADPPEIAQEAFQNANTGFNGLMPGPIPMSTYNRQLTPQTYKERGFAILPGCPVVAIPIDPETTQQYGAPINRSFRIQQKVTEQDRLFTESYKIKKAPLPCVEGVKYMEKREGHHVIYGGTTDNTDCTKTTTELRFLEGYVFRNGKREVIRNDEGATLYAPVLFVRGTPFCHPVNLFAEPMFEKDNTTTTKMKSEKGESKWILDAISEFTSADFSQQYIMQEQDATVRTVFSKPRYEAWATDDYGMCAATTPLCALRHIQAYMAYTFNNNHSMTDSLYRITEDDVYLSGFGCTSSEQVESAIEYQIEVYKTFNDVANVTKKIKLSAMKAKPDVQEAFIQSIAGSDIYIRHQSYADVVADNRVKIDQDLGLPIIDANKLCNQHKMLIPFTKEGKLVQPMPNDALDPISEGIRQYKLSDFPAVASTRYDEFNINVCVTQLPHPQSMAFNFDLTERNSLGDRVIPGFLPPQTFVISRIQADHPETLQTSDSKINTGNKISSRGEIETRPLAMNGVLVSIYRTMNSNMNKGLIRDNQKTRVFTDTIESVVTEGRTMYNTVPVKFSKPISPLLDVLRQNRMALEVALDPKYDIPRDSIYIRCTSPIRKGLVRYLFETSQTSWALQQNHMATIGMIDYVENDTPLFPANLEVCMESHYNLAFTLVNRAYLHTGGLGLTLFITTGNQEHIVMVEDNMHRSFCCMKTHGSGIDVVASTLNHINSDDKFIHDDSSATATIEFGSTKFAKNSTEKGMKTGLQTQFSAGELIAENTECFASYTYTDAKQAKMEEIQEHVSRGKTNSSASTDKKRDHMTPTDKLRENRMDGQLTALLVGINRVDMLPKTNTAGEMIENVDKFAEVATKRAANTLSATTAEKLNHVYCNIFKGREDSTGARVQNFLFPTACLRLTLSILNDMGPNTYRHHPQRKRIEKITNNCITQAYDGVCVSSDLLKENRTKGKIETAQLVQSVVTHVAWAFDREKERTKRNKTRSQVGLINKTTATALGSIMTCMELPPTLLHTTFEIARQARCAVGDHTIFAIAAALKIPSIPTNELLKFYSTGEISHMETESRRLLVEYCSSIPAENIANTKDVGAPPLHPQMVINIRRSKEETAGTEATEAKKADEKEKQKPPFWSNATVPALKQPYILIPQTKGVVNPFVDNQERVVVDRLAGTLFDIAVANLPNIEKSHSQSKVAGSYLGMKKADAYYIISSTQTNLRVSDMMTECPTEVSALHYPRKMWQQCKGLDAMINETVGIDMPEITSYDDKCNLFQFLSKPIRNENDLDKVQGPGVGLYFSLFQMLYVISVCDPTHVTQNPKAHYIDIEHVTGGHATAFASNAVYRSLARVPRCYTTDIMPTPAIEHATRNLVTIIAPPPNTRPLTLPREPSLISTNIGTTENEKEGTQFNILSEAITTRGFQQLASENVIHEEGPTGCAEDMAHMICRDAFAHRLNIKQYRDTAGKDFPDSMQSGVHYLVLTKPSPQRVAENQQRFQGRENELFLATVFINPVERTQTIKITGELPDSYELHQECPEIIPLPTITRNGAIATINMDQINMECDDIGNTDLVAPKTSYECETPFKTDGHEDSPVVRHGVIIPVSAPDTHQQELSSNEIDTDTNEYHKKTIQYLTPEAEYRVQFPNGDTKDIPAKYVTPNLLQPGEPVIIRFHESQYAKACIPLGNTKTKRNAYYWAHVIHPFTMGEWLGKAMQFPLRDQKFYMSQWDHLLKDGVDVDMQERCDESKLPIYSRFKPDTVFVAVQIEGNTAFIQDNVFTVNSKTYLRIPIEIGCIVEPSQVYKEHVREKIYITANKKSEPEVVSKQRRNYAFGFIPHLTTRNNGMRNGPARLLAFKPGDENWTGTPTYTEYKQDNKRARRDYAEVRKREKHWEDFAFAALGTKNPTPAQLNFLIRVAHQGLAQDLQQQQQQQAQQQAPQNQNPR